MLKNYFPERDFKALLFDFDGTVADTMPAHLKAWNIGLAAYGLTLSREQHMAWAGRPTRNIVEMISDMHKVKIPVEQFLKEKETHYVSSLDQIKAIASVMDVIKHYHGKIPMAVVTGSRRKAVDLTANHLDIAKYFESFVCAEDYVNGKPAPDCFIMGASRLGVDPKECLAFEDAQLGIQAATSAGMSCLFVDELQKLKVVKA